MCVEDELGCHMLGWMTQSTGVLVMKVMGSVTTPGKNKKFIIIVSKWLIYAQHLPMTTREYMMPSCTTSHHGRNALVASEWPRICLLRSPASAAILGHTTGHATGHKH